MRYNSVNGCNMLYLFQSNAKLIPDRPLYHSSAPWLQVSWHSIYIMLLATIMPMVWLQCSWYHILLVVYRFTAFQANLWKRHKLSTLANKMWRKEVLRKSQSMHAFTTPPPPPPPPTTACMDPRGDGIGSLACIWGELWYSMFHSCGK